MSTEMNNVLPDIPRLFTALAEWLACMQCIWELKRRLHGWKFGLVAALALILQGVFLTATSGLNDIRWLICMLAAISIMYFLIYSCCRVGRRIAGYYCIRAFVIAEFAASFEWQIACFLFGNQLAEQGIGELLLLIMIYGVVFSMSWYIYRPYVKKGGRVEVTNRELISYIIIGGAIFLVSNVGFVPTDTPFSGSYPGDVFAIRTLVDLGGVAVLYAYHVQRVELRVRYELENVQKIFHDQYMQYQQSRELIELINYKYHDLKHQIVALRAEDNPDRKNEYLDQMENEIKNYEAQNKTGNKVLDTLLTAKSLYCNKLEISITSVVDGTLFDFMDTMDICSIFGNALDNAIEYESKIIEKEKRLIHVTAFSKRNFLIIRFENFCEETLIFDKNFPVTTKKEAQFHGFGLKSLRNTVKKYDGEVDISIQNNWFNLKILIPFQ